MLLFIVVPDAKSFISKDILITIVGAYNRTFIYQNLSVFCNITITCIADFKTKLTVVINHIKATAKFESTSANA